MHFGDSIFIFLLALVLFGPKKLPEIGRTIGKLLAEFRRASNEFKFQIQEELRNMEEDERRTKLAERQVQSESATQAASPMAELTAGTESSSETSSGPMILPPSTGAPVSTEKPYATAPAAESSEGMSAANGAEPAEKSELEVTGQTNGSYNPGEVARAEPVRTGAGGEPVHHG